MLPGIKAILDVAFAMMGVNPAESNVANVKKAPPPAKALTELPIKPIMNTSKNDVTGSLKRDCIHSSKVLPCGNNIDIGLYFMQNQKQQPIFNAVSPIILLLISMICFVSLSGLFFPFMFKVLKFYGALIPSEFTISESYRLITYGFLHVDYAHLGMNMLWLLIFASPIQRFFGTQSVFIIFTMGVIAGGLIFLTYDNQAIIMGASAGVSACGGAALRFMLKPASDFYGNPQIYKLTDGRFLLPSVLFFITDIGNALFMSHAGHTIAWQSHIIGYIVGAILMEFRFINHGAIHRNKLTSSEETYLGD
jgi:membrane associated rhomboid family serine protease